MNDILLKDNDLHIVNGDFAVGDNLVQRQQLIVQSAKNDFKQHPEMGVDAEMYLEDELPQELFAEIREQFVMDGMKVLGIGFNKDGSIYIDAE